MCEDGSEGPNSEAADESSVLRVSARVTDGAARALWQAVAELSVDLAAAISKARHQGLLSPVGSTVLYMYYSLDRTLEEIAKALRISPNQARCLHRSALKAIRDTGLLDGYCEEGKGVEQDGEEASVQK